MMTRAPSEDELLRLTEELNAARSHVMSSRRRAFEYIDRISELEATRMSNSDSDLKKRIADLETELEQQVNLVYHLEQERIAVSNLEDVRKMIEKIPLPPSIDQRLSRAFKQLQLRHRKMPKVFVKAPPDKTVSIENEKLKRQVKVLQNDIMHLEDQIDIRKEDYMPSVSPQNTYFRRKRGNASSPFDRMSPNGFGGGSFPEVTRSRQASKISFQEFPMKRARETPSSPSERASPNGFDFVEDSRPKQTHRITFQELPVKRIRETISDRESPNGFSDDSRSFGKISFQDLPVKRIRTNGSNPFERAPLHGFRNGDLLEVSTSSQISKISFEEL